MSAVSHHYLPEHRFVLMGVATRTQDKQMSLDVLPPLVLPSINCLDGQREQFNWWQNQGGKNQNLERHQTTNKLGV